MSSMLKKLHRREQQERRFERRYEKKSVLLLRKERNWNGLGEKRKRKRSRQNKSGERKRERHERRPNANARKKENDSETENGIYVIEIVIETAREIGEIGQGTETGIETTNGTARGIGTETKTGIIDTADTMMTPGDAQPRI